MREFGAVSADGRQEDEVIVSSTKILAADGRQKDVTIVSSSKLYVVVVMAMTIFIFILP